MLSYVVRRLLYSLPILLGVMVLTFLLFRIVQTPDTIALNRLGPKASQLAREEFIRKEGLDLPMSTQLGRYLWRTMRFDLGQSWKNDTSVGQTFREGIGPTMLITVPGFIAGLVAALGLALFQVFVRNSKVDRSLTVACVGLMSIPTVVYIIFCQAVLALMLNYFPASGFEWRGLATAKFVILPILIMGIVNLGYDTRLFRAIFLEEIGQDYVRTAQAKGVPSGRVLGKHVLKNGLIAIITLTVGQLPKLIAGSLLIENFFGIPGMGNVLVMAIQLGDQPVVMASVYLGALLYLGALILTDILYAAADPRIRLG